MKKVMLKRWNDKKLNHPTTSTRTMKTRSMTKTEKKN